MVRLWSIPLSVRWESDAALPEPHVIVTNHCSYLDCIFVAALLPRPHVVVVKAELQRIPILSTYLRKLGSIFVERSAPDRRRLEIRQMEDALARGTSVIVFPEGTFTRVAGLLPFHLGAFEIAVVSSVPVIPLTLHGTRSVLRDGRWLPRRLPVRAVVGAPLRLPTGKDALSATLRLRDLARAEVLQHCGEPDLL
jgi:1-acyl-sn-glycerol-3-phosphate acyltransferase